MDECKQSLLGRQPQLLPTPTANTNTSISSSSCFTPDPDGIPPINNIFDFTREFYREFKKIWYLAFPATFNYLCQFSLGAITQVFAGHVSRLALAAVSIENSAISGFSFGILLGLASALETLCGQAYGAGESDMLGIYMQRSWVFLNTTAIGFSLLHIFAGPVLRLIGQTAAISEAAGTFALWMIPQLFAYAMNFPIAKFLQSQSKIMVMALISMVALILHTLFSWLFMVKLEWGLVGAAVVLNSSWWFIVLAQLLYIFRGTCGQAWSGFSWKAFQNLWAFVRLSLASAVMCCLDMWYPLALTVLAGYLQNAEVSVDAFSISMNILSWVGTIATGLNIAVSVRVSNELGAGAEAGHPRTAKFSLVVAVISSILIALIFSLILIITRSTYPDLFSSDEEVKDLVQEMTPLLAFSILISNVQPVLAGVAVGAGWQAVVAYVNIACYYLCGIPLGLILGYKLEMGVRGIWYGMLTGTTLQSCIIFRMVVKTNWNKEASIAEERIRTWKGKALVDGL